MIELPQKDQAALSWYFTAGASAFERSTMGPMLDRAELYALKRTQSRCRRCSRQATPGILEDGAWCPKCHGTGYVQSRVDHAERSEDELPVNETRSSEGGYTPDDATMTRYAIISRRLSLLPKLWQDALESYHGPKGERCAHPPGWRLVSLYPLVEPGRRLVMLADEHLDDLARERYRGEPAYEKCWWQVAWQKTRDVKQRAALIAAAEEQATVLHDEASRGWLVAGGANAA